VAGRVRALNQAARLAARSFDAIADDLREARIGLGLTQAEVARAVGVSRSRVCRIERGRATTVTLEYLWRHAAVVGLRASVKLYPIGGALRDAAQARYIARFVERVGRQWRVRLDVPIPLPGDLRGIDVLLEGACVICVEVVTRLRDLQAVLRASQLKQRDIGAARLIIVVAATHANRRALAEARPTLLATFDLDTHQVLAKLAAGHDPGRDAIIVLS
jgi:transcriptional regulator with XRE-family HTH domain